MNDPKIPPFIIKEENLEGLLRFICSVLVRDVGRLKELAVIVNDEPSSLNEIKHFSDGEEQVVDVCDLSLNPEETYIRSTNENLLKELIKNSLLTLNDTDREVIILRFGEDPMTLQEIADRLKVKHQRVRERQERALKKIRNYFESLGINSSNDLTI